MVREEGEESRDIEEAEQVGRRPEQKFDIEEDVVERGFPLGVCKGEGGRFKEIARRSVQGQKRIPPSLPSVTQGRPRNNCGIVVEVGLRRCWVSRGVGSWSDVHVGVWGRVPPIVAEWLSWQQSICFGS